MDRRRSKSVTKVTHLVPMVPNIPNVFPIVGKFRLFGSWVLPQDGIDNLGGDFCTEELKSRWSLSRFVRVCRIFFIVSSAVGDGLSSIDKKIRLDTNDLDPSLGASFVGAQRCIRHSIR